MWIGHPMQRPGACGERSTATILVVVPFTSHAPRKFVCAPIAHFQLGAGAAPTVDERGMVARNDQPIRTRTSVASTSTHVNLGPQPTAASSQSHDP